MKRVVLLFCMMAVASRLHAEKSSELSRAIAPLQDGVPQVAVVRLKAFLAGQISEEERQVAAAKLGEALATSGQSEAALKILSDPALRDQPATSFFQAQALAAEGRWDEALPLYQRAATDPASDFHAEALMGEAESWRALNNIDRALQLLRLAEEDKRWTTRARLRSAELMLAKDDPEGATRALESSEAKSLADQKERRFIRGRIEAHLGHGKKALQLFEWILKHPEGAPHPVLIATLFGIAEENLKADTPGTGDDFLEDFIDHHPSDEKLPEIFAKLDQLYAAERKPSRHDLARWSRDPAQPRRALAQWYLARAELRLGRRDMARQSFEELRAQHSAVPALAGAFLEFAQMEFEERQFDRALALLDTARVLGLSPEVLERVDFLAGKIQFQAHRFEAAAKTFQRAAEYPRGHESDALINVSLAWLQAGEEKSFATTEEELSKQGEDQSTRGDLLLEKGIAEAGRDKKKAGETLRNFLRDFPQHPRVAEAWVTLAELAFHETPPKIEEARQDLARAQQNHPSPIAAERSDYLAIWIEDSANPPNETKVIEAAAQFLQRYLTSAFAADVRLKLAETYYRRQDFAAAQTQFTLLAQQNPTSPLAEKAQFFAAQSAMQSMGSGSLDRALLLFGEVVKKEGALKWAARNEQAAIERKLGKTSDASTLYDEVLKGDGKAGEKREALCAKGDILYDLGASDPENYRRAIEIYDQLAAQTEAATHWHNQALFKKGVCLERINAAPEALSTFYQIIEDGSRPDRRREFFWYYKAGFNAARLLEEQSDWKPAAAIYEKLAFAGGGRSEEAKSRLNRIRLEHFLFDQ